MARFQVVQHVGWHSRSTACAVTAAVQHVLSQPQYSMWGGTAAVQHVVAQPQYSMWGGTAAVQHVLSQPQYSMWWHSRSSTCGGRCLKHQAGPDSLATVAPDMNLRRKSLSHKAVDLMHTTPDAPDAKSKPLTPDEIRARFGVLKICLQLGQW